jgi:aspartate/methionine/tyrosine aminotransferase
VTAYLNSINASDMELHRYGSISGTSELKAAIEQKLKTENGVTLDGRTLFCTAGSNMAFLAAILAIADPGDEIILNSPYYFNHEMAVRISGCTPVCIPTGSDYELQLESIQAAITNRTRAIVTISPNNPSGAVYSQETLSKLNELCGQRGVYHIHDEAYEYFTWGPTSHFSVGSLPNSTGHTISLYSLSKAYSLAGWRLGYCIAPAPLEEAIYKVQDTNLICTPIVCQHVAVAALQSGQAWCKPQLQRMAEIRDQFQDKLRSFSFTRASQCNGAFYVLLELDTPMKDVDVVHQLISKHGIAPLPGSTFGINDRCVLRLSFGTLDASQVEVALERLERGIGQIIAAK